MSEGKVMRLSQVARKLNVATPAITAYLASRGFILENNPNTKITLEQYKILAEEFAHAAIDKEEAAELVIGHSYERDVKTTAKEEVVVRESPLATIPAIKLVATPNQEALLKVPLETPVAVVSLATGVAAPRATPSLPETLSPGSMEQQQGEVVADETGEKQTKYEMAPSAGPVLTVAAENPAQATRLVSKISLVDQDSVKGVTVLGKIVLASQKGKKFQQVTSSDVDQRSRKPPRKRIPGPPIPTTATASTRLTPHLKPNPSKTNYKGISKTPELQKAAISEKDIQEQIKHTLAKLGSAKPTLNRAKYRREKSLIIAGKQAEERLQADQDAKKLQLTEFISANDLASLMGVSINELISTCMSLGMLVSINQRLDAETITILADEFGYQVEFTDAKVEEPAEEEGTDLLTLVERSPIVTIMGHVDHGKTSLLDYIRNTKVTKTEAGGITQHIGAYEAVVENGKRIVFLDTPGHEAFTAMRARGVRLTDIAIIVIAADDGVKPQTKEAINHAKLAGLPLIIAINKIDKANANPEKVKEELAHLNILVEDWGGKYQSQGISAITGQGVDELLNKILFEAELLELKANPDKRARGTIIEASLDQGRGYLTTMMVQEGTLQVGEVVLAGGHYGKLKAMFDYQGKAVKKALPSTPVQVLGLNGAPQAGDSFIVMSLEKDAKEIATYRQQILREQGLRTKTHITLDEIGRRLAIGNFKELNLILKGDVSGSVEALADSLLKLSTEEIKVKVLYKGVGAVAESDVLLAAASDAIIVAFQVRPSANVRKLAEKEEVEIRLYSIIYDAINDIKDAMQGMLAPTVEETVTGSAAVRETFKITGLGLVAGCYVTEGSIKRSNDIHVIRDGVVIYTGTIKHLKHFKEDIQQATTGSECGINISNFNDIKVNDIIEGFEKKSIERKL